MSWAISMGFEVVCCVALNDPIVRHHLMPIAQHPLVTRLWIVRHKEIGLGQIPKAQYVLVSTRFKLWRFVQMIWICLRLGRKEQVKAFVSFNPIPYGLFSFIAARLHKKVIHFGFIGSDWNLRVKGKWGRFLLPILRKADLVTVPGRTMWQEMVQHGFDPNHVTILPHGTDLERFSIVDVDKPSYSCIFVGRLIELKRIDLILKAFSQVLNHHPDKRLCIAGDGPLMETLKSLANQLGIADRVDFVGHVENVPDYLAQARIVVIASEAEGFPSALVEGMCSGLVPVCTPVGAISDIIKDGQNGLLFPKCDPNALAKCIIKLLDQPQLYDELRRNVLELRPRFSHENVTRVWDKWFKELDLGSDKLKVLQVVSVLNRGGAETRIMELMQNMDREKIHFDFLVHQKRPGHYEKQVISSGSKVMRCGALRLLPLFCWRLYRLLKRSNYDIVHAHTLTFSAVCLTVAKWAGVKKRIAHFRNMYGSQNKTFIAGICRNILLKLILKNATHIIGNTRAVNEIWFGPNWPDNPKIHMIYNGIDTAQFHCESDSSWLKEQFQIPAEHKTVVHVGTFRPQKNHARIIGTAKAYLADNPDTCFVFVGDGALRNDIENLAKQKGINTNVRFAGIRSDAARILKSADALLFPSLSEGLPGVILEAMAAGLPIVASDLPSIREIIEICGSAELLSINAPDAEWVQALAKAIDKPRQPQGLDQIENSPFALSNSWRQLLNIYCG